MPKALLAQFKAGSKRGRKIKGKADQALTDAGMLKDKGLKAVKPNRKGVSKIDKLDKKAAGTRKNQRPRAGVRQRVAKKKKPTNGRSRTRRA